MSDINNVTLSGRLVKKPEVQYAKSGTAVCNFSVCVSNYDKQAENKQRPNFFNCVCFSSTAEALAKYLDKGDSVFCDGLLQQDTWTSKEGQKRTAVKVIVNQIVFGRAKNKQASAPEENTTEKEPQETDTKESMEFSDEPFPPIEDGECPF